ncbi:PREDICTED: ubiquitin carboxyl-terminal hydrolase 18-like [Brassica oleracea var. oleracea]|uniref:ubiquitin carboxyl-terminal hydrolase 18-like n=1 Tax=Brassica oleracea var. oleracea TaxID=109376 RepID=UPI0006A6A2AC|nr:PREDICTED: ubiquitin carboxyl-terminal hydrolase 18-like [Brassica oleracea var. oleracea]
MNVAFGGVEHVSQQPPRQPDQTGILSALALPGIGFFSHTKKSVKYFNWENPELAPCGVINCGNNCFANVILQFLSWTRPLVAYLLERGQMNECVRDDWCFFCKFETHVERASQSRFSFSPRMLLLIPMQKDKLRIPKISYPSSTCR